MNRNIFLALLVVCFAACTKEPKTRPQSTVKPATTPDSSKTAVYEMKIVNNTNELIHLEFYKTKADYMYSRNPVFTKKLDKINREYILSFPDSSTHYYLDWFSEDHRLTNWGLTTNPAVTHSMEQPVFDIAYEQQTVYYIDSSETERKVARDFILNWNDPMSEWNAVDLIGFDNQSAWNTIDDNKKHLNLRINKDMTYRMEQKDNAGKLTLKESAFHVNFAGDTNYFNAGVKVEEGVGFATYADLANWRNGPSDVRNDTLFLHTPIGYYVLHRRK